MLYPAWVTMYMWFFRHSAYTDTGDLDFQWRRRIRWELGLRNPSDAPFEWETDSNGISFLERMRERTDGQIECAVQFRWKKRARSRTPCIHRMRTLRGTTDSDCFLRRASIHLEA